MYVCVCVRACVCVCSSLICDHTVFSAGKITLRAITNVDIV